MSLSFDSGHPDASDAPSSFPSGVTFYNINDEGGWPADYGVLEVVKGDATAGCVQRLLTSGRVFTRHSGSSAWGAWYEMDRTAV